VGSEITSPNGLFASLLKSLILVMPNAFTVIFMGRWKRKGHPLRGLAKYADNLALWLPKLQDESPCFERIWSRLSMHGEFQIELLLKQPTLP